MNLRHLTPLAVWHIAVALAAIFGAVIVLLNASGIEYYVVGAVTFLASTGIVVLWAMYWHNEVRRWRE